MIHDKFWVITQFLPCLFFFSYIYFCVCSYLKCFREIEGANQKCMDCSSEIVDTIICRACAEQCHVGHTLIPSQTKLCRCVHKEDVTNSDKIQSVDTNITENAALVLQHYNEHTNQAKNTTTGGFS